MLHTLGNEMGFPMNFAFYARLLPVNTARSNILGVVSGNLLYHTLPLCFKNSFM